MDARLPESESQTITGNRHGGRHLDLTRDDALRAAALKLLGDIGYDRLTVDAIAARAGAGKATIYRRWSGKAELVVDALTCEKVVRATPNTGSLMGDLSVLARQATLHEYQLDTNVMIGLVSALPHDSELREVFRQRLVEPHVATLKEIFERAIARDEIRPLEDLDIVVSLFPALVLHRLLIVGEIPDLAYFNSIIEEVIMPLVISHVDITASAVPTAL
ncbi:MAG: TetR/AcrR family transcriptional regulator [Acidimicrobiales bacterium]